MPLSIKRMSAVAGVAVAGGYLSICLGVFLLQEKLIFPAPPGAEMPRPNGGSLLRIPTEGREVIALHYPAPAGAPTVVHFHGNGEQLADDTDWLERLHALGLGAYAIEYPGYGLARGPMPTEKGIYEAAEAGLRHLHQQLGVGPEKIILEGQSIGSGAAVEMARRGHGARLVLISPFTSMGDMASHLFPWLPVKLLLKHKFANAEKAPALSIPALVMHGTRDELVPVEMGKKMAAVLPKAELRLFEGGTHELQSAFAEPMARCVAAFARGEPCAPR